MQIGNRGQVAIPEGMRGRVGTRPGIERELIHHACVVLLELQRDESEARRQSRQAPDTHP